MILVKEFLDKCLHSLELNFTRDYYVLDFGVLLVESSLVW